MGPKRSVSVPRLAITSSGRQPLEERRLVEIVADRRFGAEQGRHEGLELSLVERDVQVVRLPPLSYREAAKTLLRSRLSAARTGLTAS